MKHFDKYFLGCPVWSCEAWKGKLFSAATKRRDWLACYAKIFNTVEGNTTFYALPTIETIQKWARETPDGFRFCLKVPRTISHDCRLVGCSFEVGKFFECLEILLDANRLGPTFLQMPPDFDKRNFNALQRFLEGVPKEFPFAVEVRHVDFFQQPLEDELVACLRSMKMDRVVFDSRPLFHFPPSDLTESEARRRKPLVAIRKEALGKAPFLRLIGVNQVDKLEPWILEWAEQVSQWIKDGRTPYVFTHTPNDEYAPDFARKFHAEVRRRVSGLGNLNEPEFSSETQLDLFS